MVNSLPPHSIEEELRLHDRAMASSSCGITIADVMLPDMPLIYVNESFGHITGYYATDILGQNCRFLQGSDRQQPELDIVRAALKTGQNCTVMLRNYHKNGTLFWNELFMSPITNAEGLVTHFVGIQTDVTARKNAEEEVLLQRTALENTLTELRATQAMLIHSEKMSALGQIVAGVAHELNNPVAFVTINLHSLQDSLQHIANAYTQLEVLLLEQGTPAQQEAARVIRQQADLDFIFGDLGDLLNASRDGLGRVKRIVESLRVFSRLDEAQLKPVDLLENIQSTLNIARVNFEGRVQIALDIPPLPLIQCYPAELNQVFLNIIINAAQAIEGKGTLTIRARETDEHIVLQFIDSGVGMTPDTMTKIFNPFFTTKPAGAGTGLGLYIAHKIIAEHHSGTISVESAPGKGSTFTITLPKVIAS